MKKRRYSFVGKKHTLKIDPDLRAAAKKYVQDQLAVLAEYNDAPEPPLTRNELSDLIYAVAKYPQTCRNLQKQLDRKIARESRRTDTA